MHSSEGESRRALTVEAAGDSEEMAQLTGRVALAATLLGNLPSCSEGSFLPPVWKKTKHCLEEDDRREVVSEEGKTYKTFLGLNICAFVLIISVFINNSWFYYSFMQHFQIY